MLASLILYWIKHISQWDETTYVNDTIIWRSSKMIRTLNYQAKWYQIHLHISFLSQIYVGIYQLEIFQLLSRQPSTAWLNERLFRLFISIIKYTKVINRTVRNMLQKNACILCPYLIALFSCWNLKLWLIRQICQSRQYTGCSKWNGYPESLVGSIFYKSTKKV